MRVRAGMLAAVMGIAGACARPTPEQTLGEDVARAMGGRERIEAVRTLSLHGLGAQFNLGQDRRPDARDQTFSVTSFERRIDLDAGRARTSMTRTPLFEFFQGPAPQQIVQGIDGPVAYNVGVNGAASRVTGGAARDRRAEFHHHPVVIARALVTGRAALANVRRQGSDRLADVTMADGTVLTLVVSPDGLPRRVESRTAHPNLGDLTLSTHLLDYREIDGVVLPTRLISYADEFMTSEIWATWQQVNQDTGDLAAPVAAASASGEPAAPRVAESLVAPGVWLLAGQSHHSALIELSDHAILVDAPQSEARTLAVIDKARALVAKPLTRLVTTHHHFDHTAGLRAAIARGLSVTTHEGNRAFVEAMASRPHTLVPDTLAREPATLNVVTVGDMRVIDDPLRTVAIYHVEGSPHSDTALMVHLPAERLLIQVDLFAPESRAHPYARNLLDNITRRSLAVERIVPLHGTVAPLSALVEAAKIGDLPD